MHLCWCNVVEIHLCWCKNKGFLSQCNVVIGYVLVLEGKLVRTSFTSWCNIVVGNALLHMLKGKLIGARFPSWCNIFDWNVVVLLSLLHNTMLLLEMPLGLC